MELDIYQKQMKQVIKTYLDVIAQKKQEPHNESLQKELDSLLFELVSINERQKVILNKLRNEKALESSSSADETHSNDPLSTDLDQDDLNRQDDLQDGDGGLSEMECRDSVQLPLLTSSEGQDEVNSINKDRSLSPSRSKADTASISALSPYCLDEDDSLPISFEDDLGQPQVEHLQSEEDSRPALTEDLHPTDSENGISDYISIDEFMHSLGLLTIRECDDVICKRKERYRKNKHAHIFNPTLWEKHESKRKKRHWLISAAFSPPQLRKKNRGSQPSSRQPSRPSTPTEGGSSSSGTSPHPLSPIDNLKCPWNEVSEEICHFCNRKGARLLCDGCGVYFHFDCIDLKEEMAQDAWLCITCERFGVRGGSSNTHAEPSLENSWRDELSKKEEVLRRRAELNATKQELQEKHDTLASHLKELQEESWFLQERKLKTINGLAQLKSFSSFFKRVSLPMDDPPAKPLTNQTAFIRLAKRPNYASTFNPGQISCIPSVSISAVKNSPPTVEDGVLSPQIQKGQSTDNPVQARSKVVPNVSLQIVPKRSLQLHKKDPIPANEIQPGFPISPPTITLSKVNPFSGMGTETTGPNCLGSSINFNYGTDLSD